MSSKSTSNGTGETLREAGATSSRAVPELTRQQFARSADWMAAGFQATGALQQVTLQMCQRAALMHLQAADNARKAASPMELLQVQSALMVHQWLEMTRYSQEWLLACTRGMAQSAARGAGPGSTAASNGAGRSADTGVGAVGPMVQAWQQMFASLASESGAGH